MISNGSSGDLAADRRYAWARGALETGDFEGARDLFAQTLERAPHWAPAWFGLGEALEALGRRDEAAAAFRDALTCDPADAAGARLRLARLAGETPVAAPRAYVQTLFDQYSATFDRHLVEKLAYRGPEILGEAVARAAPGRIFANMLDLGCGAGLAGAVFRTGARHMSGVDLSPAMIEQARAKGIYDRLVAGDLGEFLAGEPADAADLVIAADVFVYLGDLDPVFAGVARVLRNGGLFAFTCQSLDEGESYAVGADLRFAHSQNYLRGCAARAGLAIGEISPAVSRKDRGADVPGFVALLLKI
ncbi:MAG TPA: methyltransferase domain-containing protein [Rhodoblastus sp.]|nr:methyltransferase domain-containing protein [Rhodoblastus sp.]